MARLPRLRDLSVDFPSQFAEVSFAGFSNLNSIRFSCVRMTQQILDDMKGLLARSRSITQFALRPFAPSFLNFSSLFEDAMKPNFSPTLKQLTIGIDIKLSPSVAPFFRYLTSLETDVTSIQLLRIFQGSGIRLQELVAPLQQEVINYLLSYSGLRSFAGDPKLLPRTTEGKMIISQFFHAVLPKHQESIQSITFKQTGPLPGLLSITQPYLDQGVYLCKNLECLTLIYYFPSVREEHISDVLPLVCAYPLPSSWIFPQLKTLGPRLTYSAIFLTIYLTFTPSGSSSLGVTGKSSLHSITNTLRTFSGNFPPTSLVAGQYSKPKDSPNSSWMRQGPDLPHSPVAQARSQI